MKTEEIINTLIAILCEDASAYRDNKEAFDSLAWAIQADAQSLSMEGKEDGIN